MERELTSLLGVSQEPRTPPEPGDTVRVTFRFQERGQTRTQAFEGVVLRVMGGGPQTRFTVRRIGAGGIGVERTFFLYSPTLEKLEVLRRARVRRAKLLYLRELRGKKARLKDRSRTRLEPIVSAFEAPESSS